MSALPEPWQWIETDLERLVADQVRESIDLDYKDSGALDSTATNKDSISKDVSAFANGGGGTIVYGISEAGHLPTGLDGGVDPHATTREWLEQVMNSTIQRRVQGVRINQVLLHRTSPGRVAYVVAIPSSLLAPHMASDHRYYKRFNFQSVPMEEYEVRDTSRREAERAARELRERDHTPFLSLEGTGSSGAAGGISLNANIHVDGEGVAINAGFNLLVATDAGLEHVTTAVVRYLRAPNAAPLSLLCPPDFLNTQPKLGRIDAFFTNMENHVIKVRAERPSR